MKKFLFIALILLLGCGEDEPKPYQFDKFLLPGTDEINVIER